MAERATQVQRWALKDRLRGARNTQQPLGPLFEAWVQDQLDRLRVNHTVVDEQTIADHTQAGQRADAVVGYFDHYVSIEASIQRLPRGIADGDLDENIRMCRRYHREADQAQATADDLDTITGALGLPRASSRTILVVTEQSIENTPALLAELRRQQPARNPRFVCDAGEFEALVDLAERGWSFAGAVAAWQGGDGGSALSDRVVRMSRYLAPDRLPAVEPWLMVLLPDRYPSAA